MDWNCYLNEWEVRETPGGCLSDLQKALQWVSRMPLKGLELNRIDKEVIHGEAAEDPKLMEVLSGLLLGYEDGVFPYTGFFRERTRDPTFAASRELATLGYSLATDRNREIFCVC